MKAIQLFCIFLTGLLASGSVLAAVPATGHVPDQYIVTLSSGTDPASVANEMALQHGLAVRHVYRYALTGFAARVPHPSQLEGARRLRRFHLEPDRSPYRGFERSRR